MRRATASGKRKPPRAAPSRETLGRATQPSNCAPASLALISFGREDIDVLGGVFICPDGQTITQRPRGRPLTEPVIHLRGP
jgi:hypothetical protein